MLKLLYYKHVTFKMKKNNYLYIFIIILLAIFLRLYSIDKAEGLWNDEYVSWYIATQNTIGEFFKKMIDNCHMPLYYLYIKFWLFFFPDTDISLRISSVIPSILSIITMYFVGKEYKNEKIGLSCALLMAINSFAIYFAQEVRLYSLLILFTSLSLLFFIKTFNNFTKKSFYLFLIANFFICITHTIGILFSLFNISILIYYLYKNNDEFKNKFKQLFFNKKTAIVLCISAILILPFAFNIAFSKNLSQFWSDFSITKIFCTFIDYFSPIQTNIINTKPSILNYFMWTDYPNTNFIIYGFLPFIISVISIIKSLLLKEKVIKYLFTISTLFFFSLIIFAILGKIILITKYSCEIFPTLILLLAIGFNSFKFKKIGTILFLTYLILNINYLYTNNSSAPKKLRAEGNKIVIDLIRKAELKNNDYIFLTYYDKSKFDRYLNIDETYNFDSIDKLNFHYKLFNDENYHTLIKTGKTTKKDFIFSENNEITNNFFEKNYKNKMNKGDKIALVFLDSVSFLDENEIQNIKENETLYNKTSFIFLLFSSIKNNAIKYFNNEYTFITKLKDGAWSIYIYEK